MWASVPFLQTPKPYPWTGPVPSTIAACIRAFDLRNPHREMQMDINVSAVPLEHGECTKPGTARWSPTR